MEPIIRYLILVNVCIILFYTGFIYLQKKENNPRILRIFLLISIGISLTLPLSKFRISLPAFTKTENTEVLTIQKNTHPEEQQPYTTFEENTVSAVEHTTSIDWNWKKMAGSIYVFGSAIVLLRFVFRFLIILSFLGKAKHKRLHETDFLTSPVSAAPFSFLQWIFIPENLLDKHEARYILSHEKAHVNQFHSFDIILIELLLVAFWYNPFLWMLKKSIELVHEYQADEEVVKSGYNTKTYQELLVNLVAEEKLISLTSGFSKSIIFKRIEKMKQPEFKQTKGFKLTLLLPVTALLFFAVSCLNGQRPVDEKVSVFVVDKANEKTNEKAHEKANENANEKVADKTENGYAVIAPTKMNVLYAGIDNPVDIAVSGYNPKDIEVSATNAYVVGENGKYIFHPRLPGNVVVKLTSKGETIQKSEFRVKQLPEPYAHFAEKRGGIITKEVLLNGNLKAEMAPDFDFTVDFVITKFKVYGVLGGFAQEYPSESAELTVHQRAFIEKLQKGDKIYFTDIECVGPDGRTMKLPTLDFIIDGQSTYKQ